jgi:glutathione S-transferase
MHLYIGNRCYSSWSFRPWILLRAKGIAFEETLVPLRLETSTGRIQEVSPSGKLPCLVDRGVTVWESLAIIEYLADKFPEKDIWPASLCARTHARAISAEMHAGFVPLRQHCPMSAAVRFAARPLPADVLADVARITAIWTQARTRFADVTKGPFLYGDFSAADAMYAPVVSRFHSYSMPLDSVSQAYVQAMRGHPAYQAWIDAAAAEPWVLAQNEDETIVEDLRAKR